MNASPVKKLRQQFADTMLEVGKADPDLAVLIGDISHFILQPFAKACPGRFYNVGICEPTIISMGAGLAKAGLIPVMHTIAPFLIERSFEQIKLDFCYQELGGTLITVGSAFDYANLGCTHHCYTDWALIRMLPQTQIFYPGSAQEFDLLFRQVYRNGKLKLFRLPEFPHQFSFAENDIRMGKGVKICEGDNLTILATGPHLLTALDARDALNAIHCHPEILYFPTIHPLDTELIRESARKTRKVLVMEEHVRTGGVGEETLSVIYDLEGVKFEWLGIPSRFIREYRPYQQHCAALGLSIEGIIEKARILMQSPTCRKTP